MEDIHGVLEDGDDTTETEQKAIGALQKVKEIMENVEAVQAEQKQILHKAMKTLQGGIDTNDYETTHSSRLLLTLPTLKTISLSTLMRELNNASWKRCSGAWFFRDVSLMKSNHDGILNLYTSLQVRAGIVFQERLRKQTLQESLIKAFTDGISENSETRNDVLDTKRSYDRLQLLELSLVEPPGGRTSGTDQSACAHPLQPFNADQVL